MRATEVLKRYADGRRDFSGENLRGQSFKGKDLSGANFSEADIRGASFTNAMLCNVNFREAKAGLQSRWTICLVVGGLLFSALAGLTPATTGYFVEYLLLGLPTPINPLTIAMIAISLIPFLVILITPFRWGLEVAFQALFITVVITVVGAGVVAIVSRDVPLIEAGAIGGALILTLAEVAAIAVVFAGVGSKALVGSLVGAVAGVIVFQEAMTGAVGLASTVVLLGNYVGWRALAFDERFLWIWRIGVAIAATGGTSFRNANLTDADLTSATLKSTDFRNATLTRTNLHQTKKLDRARVGNTILMDAKVRDLVVTHQGAKQSYIGCNLKGANLIGADLNDSDLTEADISGANLQQAWLERANLTKTQALNTNFHEAHLTGACLEAWNIDSTTQLNGAICDYVYLLNNHQERRPNSGEFAPEEFTKLFEEVLTTVDLIFRNGIDWKAFVLSFNAVQAKNEGTELSLQSIENKGDGVVVARLNVSEDADKEKIHSDFMQSYELALKAVEETYKAKLNAKDEQIEIYRQKSSEMKEIVSLLANRPINVDVKAIADSKSMNESTDQSRNLKIGDVSGGFNASTGAISLGDISGIVTNTINQLPSSSEPEKAGIKELLVQLQAAINDPNLADDDKEQVLEQIKVLAEAGQNPNKETAQKQAKRAMGFLKVIAEGLPSAAQLVKTCQDVLPAIALFFGL